MLRNEGWWGVPAEVARATLGQELAQQTDLTRFITSHVSHHASKIVHSIEDVYSKHDVVEVCHASTEETSAIVLVSVQAPCAFPRAD